MNDTEHNPDNYPPYLYGAPEYRLLRVGEIVKEGDEYDDGDEGEHWAPAPFVGAIIESNDSITVRRRIEPAATEPTTEQVMSNETYPQRYVDALNAEIARLKAELDAAKADSAMLDWLESDQCYWVEIQSNPSGKRIYYGQPSDKDLYINLRAAIADAMKGAQQ